VTSTLLGLAGMIENDDEFVRRPAAPPRPAAAQASAKPFADFDQQRVAGVMDQAESLITLNRFDIG